MKVMCEMIKDTLIAHKRPAFRRGYKGETLRLHPSYLAPHLATPYLSAPSQRSAPPSFNEPLKKSLEESIVIFIG